MTDKVRVPLPREYEERLQTLVSLLRWRGAEELRLIESLDHCGTTRDEEVGEPARVLDDAVRMVRATLHARGMPCTRETASRAVVRQALDILGAGARA